MKNQDNYSLSDLENDILEENSEIEKGQKTIAGLIEVAVSLENKESKNDQILNLLNPIPNLEKSNMIFPSTDSGSLISNHEDFIASLNKLNEIKTDNIGYTFNDGTASVYSVVKNHVIKRIDEPLWFGEFQKQVGEIAEQKQSEDLFLNQIESLNPSLVEIYQKAVEDYQKATNYFLDAYHAAQSIRNFIKLFWGELGALSRKNNSEINQRLALKSERNRDLVARSISKQEDYKFLRNRLKDLHNLHGELSLKLKD